MTEAQKIVLTALVTVFSGTVVLVAGQLAIKFVIEPIHALWRLRGEITDSLIFHANVYMNVGYVAQELADKASDVFRQQACQLLARAHQVPCYGFLERLGVVPKRQNLEGAHRELIGLSNSVHANPQQPAEALDRQLEFNRIRRDKLVKLLDLRIDRESGGREMQLNVHRGIRRICIVSSSILGLCVMAMAWDVVADGTYLRRHGFRVLSHPTRLSETPSNLSGLPRGGLFDDVLSQVPSQASIPLSRQIDWWWMIGSILRSLLLIGMPWILYGVTMYITHGFRAT